MICVKFNITNEMVQGFIKNDPYPNWHPMYFYDRKTHLTIKPYNTKVTTTPVFVFKSLTKNAFN